MSNNEKALLYGIACGLILVAFLTVIFGKRDGKK